MSFKKSLAEKIFTISRTPNLSLTNCRISNPPIFRRRSGKPNIAPDPGDSISRRLFHKNASPAPEFRKIPVIGTIREKLRALDVARDRIRLDGLLPPALPEMEAAPEEGLTVEDARKLVRAAQVEVVKSRLREAENGWMTSAEFLRVCCEACSDKEQGARVAKHLDESGHVIVLGNVVFLRPEQIVKAIGGLIPFPATNPHDPRRRELQMMETLKGLIDNKARTLVRRELWAGLGFLILQTAAFMRLTFWELSWDVMEPICFYLTSMYCMAGYAFFLRTSKEPSFEGFYQTRFLSKQKNLMKLHNFDAERYNELRKVCHPYSSRSDQAQAFALFDQVGKKMS